MMIRDADGFSVCTTFITPPVRVARGSVAYTQAYKPQNPCHSILPKKSSKLKCRALSSGRQPTALLS